MALLTPQVIPVTGLEATYAAASASGDTITPRADQVLHVINGAGAPITVTLVRPGTQFGQANPDVDVVVTNGEGRFIKVPSEFRDTDGLIDVTYSSETSVTVALLVL